MESILLEEKNDSIDNSKQCLASCLLNRNHKRLKVSRSQVKKYAAGVPSRTCGLNFPDEVWGKISQFLEAVHVINLFLVLPHRFHSITYMPSSGIGLYIGNIKMFMSDSFYDKNYPNGYIPSIARGGGEGEGETFLAKIGNSHLLSVSHGKLSSYMKPSDITTFFHISRGAHTFKTRRISPSVRHPRRHRDGEVKSKIQLRCKRWFCIRATLGNQTLEIVPIPRDNIINIDVRPLHPNHPNPVAKAVAKMPRLGLGFDLVEKRSIQLHMPAIVSPPGERSETLACRLLSVTLLDNLERVLQKVMPPNSPLYETPSCVSRGLSRGITRSFSQMCSSLPPGSVVISGSSIVQAILGAGWGGDLDIYCTSGSAPYVRKWLVDEAGKTLVNVKRGYSSRILSLSNESNIVHVEQYGNTPKDGAEIFDKLWPDRPDLGFPFSYSKAIKGMLKFNQAYSGPGGFPGIVAAGDTHIPFEGRLLDGRDGDGNQFINVDLIVLEPGAHVVKSIQKSFDLEICKSVWDGTSFLITNLDDTIQKRTRLSSNFNNMLSMLYMKYLDLESKRDFTSIMLDLVGMEKVRTTPYEYLEDHHSLEKLLGSLEWFYNNRCVFGKGFDESVIEYCETVASYENSHFSHRDYRKEDIRELFSNIRKVLVHNALTRVVKDDYFVESRPLTTLVNIVERIIDMIDVEQDLKSVLEFAVGNLQRKVGYNLGDAWIHFNDDQWDSAVTEWKGMGNVPKVEFLGKFLKLLVRVIERDLALSPNGYCHEDDDHASGFRDKFRKLLCADDGDLPFDNDDTPSDPLFFHCALAKNANRWMKYIHRGIDIDGVTKIAMKQRWDVLSVAEF